MNQNIVKRRKQFQKIKAIYGNLTIKKQKDLDVYYNNIKKKVNINDKSVTIEKSINQL